MEHSHEHLADHLFRTRRPKGGGRILRYTLSERVHHWLAALTYIYCLITGLAFWSPYMFWLADLVGGGPDGSLLASVVWPGFHALNVLDVQDVAWRHADHPRGSRLEEGHGALHPQ